MATMETIEINDIATGAITDGTQALQHEAYDVQEFDCAVETYQRLAAAVSGSGGELHTAPAVPKRHVDSVCMRVPKRHTVRQGKLSSRAQVFLKGADA